MNKREYAISLGLAKPGRGRLSREAHAAIDAAIAEGMVFSDAKPTAEPFAKPSEGSEPEVVVTAKPAQQRKRDITTYTLTTKAGQIIRFEHCGLCKQAILYCSCRPEPQPPAWIASEVETWLPEPAVVG